MNTTVCNLLTRIVYSESKRQLGKKPFDMAEFKLLTDLRQQRDYLNDHAMYIGAGSSRIAYGVSPKHVIKLAGGTGFKIIASDLRKVEAGRAQNEAEVENYARASVGARQLLPRTVGVPYSQFNWIITELVRPVTGYEEMRALAFGNHQIVGEGGVVQSMGGLLNMIYNAYVEEDEFMAYQIELIKQTSNRVVALFIDNVMSVADELGLSLADIKRPAQWGKSADGRLVLLDFGGTEDILDDYY